MKTYFGSLDINKFNALQKEAQTQYLISKKLFEIIPSYPIDGLDSKLALKGITKSQKLKPNKDVLREYYDFVIRQFEFEIMNKFVNFFNEFNDKIYGLEKLEQKKIGLQYFNELYDQVDVKNVRLLRKEISDTGVVQFKNINRFENLKYRQDGIKQNIATLDNVIEFLIGNKEFFNNELLENNTYFNKAINFEYILRVLVSLNDRHHFEEDLFFSDLGILKAIFENYTHIFYAFEVFVFVHKKIKDLKPSEIESLYEALLQLDLIGGKTSYFINYLNKEHGLKTTKIRRYGSKINREHDFRVKNYKRELQKLSIAK